MASQAQAAVYHTHMTTADAVNAIDYTVNGSIPHNHHIHHHFL